MRQAGFSPEACLDFDLAAVQFDHWVESRKHQTRSAPAPPAPRRPTVQVPKFESLADLLDLENEEEIAATMPDFEERVADLMVGAIDLEQFGLVDDVPDDTFDEPM